MNKLKTKRNHVKLQQNFQHNLVDGKWKFQCQHGPRECYGNKMQACALNQNSSQGTNVNFVTCVMGQQDPSSDAALQTVFILTFEISNLKFFFSVQKMQKYRGILW